MTATNDRPRAMPPLAKPGHAPRRSALGLALTATFAAQAAPGGGLTALSLEQLLEVRIVGASKYEQRQSEVAAAVSVITRQEIKAFGWRTLDEALASLPGVYSTYDRQYNYLGTRGFGLPGDLNTRQLVTINGNRVNDPTFDFAPFGRQFPLAMDLVERIEFIPGPGGAVYGQNAMFGVVNVITRSGADVSGTELDLSLQRPQALREGRASWGKKLDTGTDVLISLSAVRARGEDRFIEFGSSGVSGVAAGLDGERDRELYARVGHGPWSFEHVYGSRRKDDPTASYRSDPLVPGSWQSDRYALTQLQFQDRFAGDTLHLSGRLFSGRHNYLATLTYGTVTLFPTDSAWHGGELRLLSTAIAGHKLMAGLEAQDNRRQDQAVTNEADPSHDVLVARTGYRVGLYAQDEWHIADALTATLGLRHDRSNVNGNKLSPRVALIWRATPETTLKALYGRAHRAPNAFERDYGDGITQVANPALEGESIETVELTADHRLGQDLNLRGTLYQWSMRDLVTLGTDPASGVPQYQSGGDVKARGLELALDKTWNTGARARGSLSLHDVASRDGSKLLNSPKLLGKLNLSTPLPVGGLRVGYELRYDSRRLSLDGSHLPGYALSNLQLSSDALAAGLELSLGVYNVFDKRYLHPGSDTNWQNGFEQDGRSLRVKLSYRF